MKKYLIIAIYSVLVSLQGKAQTLTEYVQLAAENNPGLQAQYKTFEAAMERVLQVNSLPDPTLSFGYFISPVETRIGPQRARLSLNQMFPWFGTLKARGDVATLKAEAQYQEFLDAKNKLYFQVASAYFPLYELSQLIQIETQNVVILESYKTIVTTSYENGEGTLVDVLRVDLMLKGAITSLDILQKKREPLQASFNQLLNRKPSEQVIITDSISVSEPLVTRDSLYDNNPVLNELDLRIQASEKQALLAEKEGLPKIGVGLDYVLVGKRTDMTVNDNGRDALMPMISVGIPIFRGKYTAAKKEAQLLQEGYSLQKENRINQLTSAYEMAVFEIEQQAALITLYNEQSVETQQILTLLLSAYSNSGKEFEEVLRLQQQLLMYQKMKASALKDHQIAIAKLNYLTAKTY